MIDLIIPDKYKTYIPTPGVTEEFLVFDSGPISDRILLFGRPRAPDILNACDVWFGDGTFDVVPKLFYQLFVIFGARFGVITPLLFALLPNKTKETYSTLFNAMKDIGVANFQFTFCCDYEMAVIKEFRKVFSESNIGGCLFHLAQNIIKHVRQLGLMPA